MTLEQTSEIAYGILFLVCYTSRVDTAMCNIGIFSAQTPGGVFLEKDEVQLPGSVD